MQFDHTAAEIRAVSHNWPVDGVDELLSLWPRAPLHRRGLAARQFGFMLLFQTGRDLLRFAENRNSAEREGISNIRGGLGEFHNEQYGGSNTLLAAARFQERRNPCRLLGSRTRAARRGIVQSPVKRPATLAKKQMPGHSA